MKHKKKQNFELTLNKTKVSWHVPSKSVSQGTAVVMVRTFSLVRKILGIKLSKNLNQYTACSYTNIDKTTSLPYGVIVENGNFTISQNTRFHAPQSAWLFEIKEALW